ncbi:hypothetical protein [Calothrix sp. 336/3]|uniref:hypothetical protein n=1 Tax=Calothrix sp. 336/3 TaxID=1337936 RepID=UPI00143A1D09|nr:hypothetical protein [Calothrix sp. 336/3]
MLQFPQRVVYIDVVGIDSYTKVAIALFPMSDWGERSLGYTGYDKFVFLAYARGKL